jgi:phosphohistidine phosphatase
VKATIMRRLIILRHAKAERASPGGRDFDRTLAPRGREDAAKVGAYMAQHGLVPDHALVSPAKRTRETWTLVVAALSATPALKYDERLYDAKAETILQVVREAPAQAHSVCVVAHNPGLHQLCLVLVGAGDRDSRDRLAVKLPTSGLVVIDFAVDVWDRLRPHHGRLDRFVNLRQVLD